MHPDQPCEDMIHIRDLTLPCIIGTNAEERVRPQTVVINITLYTDTRRAADSDALSDTVNYRTLKKNVIALVKQSSFFLLERLAAAIAEVCLNADAVTAVTVCVDKPGALRFARSVAVEIFRYKHDAHT